MRKLQLSLLASASLCGVLFQAGLSTSASAQALAGKVSSAEESAMEGVLVSAKKEGSTITVTVVTDDKGQYSFPTDRLEPGKYAISIRAGGYDLDGPKSVDIAAGGAKADIKLVKIKNLANSLTNAEWLTSAPGPDNVKVNLIGCTSCHTYQRIFTSTARRRRVRSRCSTGWARYSPGSTPTHPQPLLPGPRGERPPIAASQMKATAEWLADRQHEPDRHAELRAQDAAASEGQARPTSSITEYDLPRKDAQPHDVIVDKDGIVWYSDFAAQFAGYIDPKTGKATDIPIPVLKPEQPKGNLDIEFDPTRRTSGSR